jgi:hypothetical protein
MNDDISHVVPDQSLSGASMSAITPIDRSREHNHMLTTEQNFSEHNELSNGMKDKGVGVSASDGFTQEV